MSIFRQEATITSGDLTIVRAPLTIQLEKTIYRLIKEFPVTCWYTVHKKMGEYDFSGDCGEPAIEVRKGIPVCNEHALW